MTPVVIHNVTAEGMLASVSIYKVHCMPLTYIKELYMHQADSKSCAHGTMHKVNVIAKLSCRPRQHDRTMTLRGYKVSMKTHTYPHKPLGKIKVDICNHQVDSPFYLWPDVCSGDMQAQKRAWSYMTLNILTETRCHTTQKSKSYLVER